jgi:hypothetical protein
MIKRGSPVTNGRLHLDVDSGAVPLSCGRGLAW